MTKLNFLKRAILAVTRRVSKTVIMFIIFAAIANLVLAGFAIQHATEAASDLARQKLGGQLTLSFDRQKAMEKAFASQTSEQQGRPRIETEPITEDMVNKISGLKNILDYNYIVSANGLANNFEAVVVDTSDSTTQDSSSENNQNNLQENNRARGGSGGFGGGDFVTPDVVVTGVSSNVLLDNFNTNDGDKLISGRNIDSSDAGKKVALIEKNLADQNNLKVDSKIKIQAARAEDVVEYTIVGIYQAASTDTTSQFGDRMNSLSFMEPSNRIYVDFKSALTLKNRLAEDGTVSNGGIDSAVFYLNDPKNVETVKTAALKLNIDWDKFVLDANDNAYKQMMGPIENVASFSMLVIWLVAIAGAIILALVLMLWVKERMYETGVLLSMGESKFKVIGQYVTEVVLIAVVAFAISSFSGQFIAQSVGESLLQKEVKSAQEQGVNNFTQGGGGRNFAQGGRFGMLLSRRFSVGTNGDIKPIDSIKVQISAKEVGQMSGVGFLIILLGTILPASTVMRYKPKTILTKAT